MPSSSSATLSHVATTMQTLILPDWNYPLTRRPMTDAKRWTRDHGFISGTDFVNHRGENLAQLLNAEPTATESGTVYTT